MFKNDFNWEALSDKYITKLFCASRSNVCGYLIDMYETAVLLDTKPTLGILVKLKLVELAPNKPGDKLYTNLLTAYPLNTVSDSDENTATVLFL